MVLTHNPLLAEMINLRAMSITHIEPISNGTQEREAKGNENIDERHELA
jgi:hypothetical protein